MSATLRWMKRNRPALFKGRHFEAEIIVLCVRWYLRFGLSFRNLEEMMAERNLHVDHVTIWRWVQRYAPELNRRCRPELRTTNAVVEGRRDVLAGGRQVDLFISGGGFDGCHDRFSAIGQTGCGSRKAILAESLAVAGSPSSPSDQRGREPVVSQGDRRVEEGRGTGAPVPLPTGPVPEQHRGARPSGDQAAGSGQPRLPRLPVSGAHDSRHRDDEHDPQRTGKVVVQRRHRGACSVCFRIARTRHCGLTQSDQRANVLMFARLQHFPSKRPPQRRNPIIHARR